MGGGDVERGEAVEERGAAEEGGAGADGGSEPGEVPGLRRAEEVHLLAGAAAAGTVPHRPPRLTLDTPRRRAGRGGRRGIMGEGRSVCVCVSLCEYERGPEEWGEESELNSACAFVWL